MLAALTALLLPALAGSVLVVAPDGPYRGIREALDAARPGDTVEVHGGIHPGPIVLDRAVALVGVDAPVIDGGGVGTVLTVSVPGAVVRGLVVRASGSDLNASDAGIEVRASDVVVEGNRLEDVLHGISLDNAPRAIIRTNRIRGKDLPEPERGDGLRLWYSSDVLVEGNEVEAARDCVVWYSERVRLVNNRVRNGRYGLHFMYNDGAELVGNELRGNSVGAYVMYSRGLLLRDNLLVANRGPSGFGLGLKDVDDIVAEGNWIVDNRVGIWSDTSPRSLDAESRFHRNVLALNDVAVTLQPSTRRNSFWENEFRDNLQQVSVLGGGQLQGNRWAVDGRGNYWSDYRGFDFDGDGVGDLPYRAEAAFSDLMDRHPELRLFQFDLAVGAVEFTAQAFPLLRPPPRLEDPAPLMAPPAIPPLAARQTADAGPAAGVALGLLTLAGSVLGLSRTEPGGSGAPRPQPAGGVVLAVDRLRKRFGRQTAVEDLSFTVAPGEVVALWGPNGAGKTTALKCILGLLPCQGGITVAGLDARRHGKWARGALGYVPQEVALHDDLSVAATASFYARLRCVPPDDARALLATMGLADHLRKPVGALSGGLRQRLALALALLGDPPLLLLDEPTSNLDAAGREQILRDLAALRARGKAILFCSHRLEEVEAIADRVLVLERGRLAFTCPPHELARRLGLRLNLKLRVAQEAYGEAVAALRAGGLTPSPNGSGIRLQVLPAEKVLPIRLLERAGIAVVDFSIEDGAARHDHGEEP